MKWTTATGQKLDIKDMTTRHIRNCIAHNRQLIEEDRRRRFGLTDVFDLDQVTEVLLITSRELKREKVIKKLTEELERRKKNKYKLTP